MSDPFELLSETPPEKAPDPSLPPNSPEAELGVLGCILLSNEAFDEVIEYGVTPQWFYELKHRDLFVVMLSMLAERKAIDIVTLSNELANWQNGSGWWIGVCFKPSRRRSISLASRILP